MLRDNPKTEAKGTQPPEVYNHTADAIGEKMNSMTSEVMWIGLDDALNVSASFTFGCPGHGHLITPCHVILRHAPPGCL